MIADEHFEFFHAIWTRRTPMTKAFLAINILMFLLMSFAGGTTNETTLMAFGVKSNAEIAQGQWWRFITPIFIHIGILHLLFNSYALWIVGPQVEKLYGTATFVVLYMLTGVAGVVGSYIYHPYSISAGASGAIFGLFGVLLAFGFRYRKSIPPEFKRAVGTGVLPVIVINLIIGFTIPAIDNSAHISGLLAGAALALFVPYQKPGTMPHSFLRAAQVGLLLLAAVSFYEVFTHYNGPRLSAQNLGVGLTQFGGVSSSTQDFIEALNDSQNAFENSSRELESDNPSPGSVKAELTEAIDELRDIPSLAAKSDELTGEMLEVLQEQYAILEDVERSGRTTFANNLRLRRNKERYENVMKDIVEWVNSEGRNYGIQMGNPR
jgi:membrane associated rhomboid family serine protease